MWYEDTACRHDINMLPDIWNEKALSEESRISLMHQ